MRVGELLVRTGLVTPAQVAQALRAQVMWGGRLGTNMVEQQMIDLDTLSRVVAHQHGLPAALAKHFAAADPALQAKLSPEIAAQTGCIPLRRVGEHVAITSIAPLDARARKLVADQLGVAYRGIVPSIAAELRVRYHLERVYDIPRDARFLRSRKRTTVPVFDLGDVTCPPAPAGEPTSREPIPSEVLPESTPRIELEPPRTERRHYVRTLDQVGPPLARIPIVRAGPATLDEAATAIRRSPDRSALATRVLDAVARFTGGRPTLLVVRGDVATAWTGELAVPVDRPGPVTTALVERVVVRVPASRLPTADRLLLSHLCAHPGAHVGAHVGEDELAVAPIAVGGHVWCVVALAVGAADRLDALDPICI
ncbi:MAG TPA: hypothetical protein VK427_19530, partial [Kofleriaceae bacterium]|nr:hypothetical protein [Kofleriaceae bacterium]